MKNLLSEHSGLVLALAFFIGWTIHWVVGLLFFRGRYFQQEAEIAKQARDLEDGRFQLSRTQTDLRSKGDLVDAIQRAKTSLESKVGVLEGDLRTAAGIAAELTARSETHAAAAMAAENRLQFELTQARSEIPSNASVLSSDPVREAELATLQCRVVSLENRSSQLNQELEESRQSLRTLTASHSAEQSVRATLARAIEIRDAALVELKTDLEELHSELESSQQHAAAAETECHELRTLMAGATHDSVRERQIREDLEHRIKEREKQLAELELKSQEYQQAFNDAAEENRKIGDQLKRARTEKAAAEKSSKELESEQQRLKSRLAQSEADITALRKTSQDADQTLQSATQARDSEIARLKSEVEAAKAASESAAAASAHLEDQLATRTREFRQVRDQNEELLEELQSATKANQSLSEQLQRSIPEPSQDVAALLADLDVISRERNELAAELATLKSAPPPAPKRSGRAASPSELNLGNESV
jgi:chemotaxis protein MotB